MNLKEEIRNGYTITSESKKLWQIQMEMLRKLLKVCTKYNLKIWAEGGTLLGAIRDKGFIPWDDDIDMMMLRGDYEKLLKVAAEEFQFPYFFQAPSTDPGYFRGHAQLRRSDTTAILPGDVDQPFNQGVFIDIFVFDFLPASEEERTLIFEKIEKIRNRLHRRNYELPGSVKGYLNKINESLYFIKKGFYNEYLKMEELITKYHNPSSHLIGDVLWTSKNYHKYMRDITWYSETLNVPFEDMEIPVPKEYDKVLTTQYGDYMIPAKAPSQHGTIIIDLDRPYPSVIKELRNQTYWKTKILRFLSPRPAKN
ncbi:MAG: LicD family protein [Muribaculaceae bacterium]|nr:LicD family protein [Muribaculaceae bacterium]